MSSFLIRLIIIIGLSTGIFFLVSGGEKNIIPDVSKEGFEMEFNDLYSVENIKDKVKNFFSSISTSSVANNIFDSSSTKLEDNVDFFKQILSRENNKKNNFSSSSTSNNINNIENKNFVQKIIDSLKNQLSKKPDEENELGDVFSLKQNSIPSFTTACFPDKKQVCSSDECVQKSPKVEFTFLDKKKLLIARCDAEGCVTYNSSYKEIDNYENYQPVEPKGYIISKQKNISENGRYQYTEIITTGGKTIIYSGYCLDRGK